MASKPRRPSGGSKTIRFEGSDELVRNLTAIRLGAPKEMARALYEEAQIELAEAVERTPKDTGELRASAEVGRPEITKRAARVPIKFGGPAASYALYVHEDLEANHPIGQAKFLSSTLAESRPFMAKRLAARIDLNRMRRG